MVLDRIRARSERLLRPAADALSGVSPNALSWLSIAFAALAALSVYASDSSRLYLLYTALVLVAASGLMDALDGAVARFHGKASLRGDFLDHVLDRYSDIFLITGFTFSGFTTARYLGILALAGVLMTSYMGTQSQAVGLKRNYGGALGRADRIVLMLIALLIETALSIAGRPMVTLLGLTVFDWLLLLFAVVGNATAIQRAFLSWRLLHS